MVSSFVFCLSVSSSAFFIVAIGVDVSVYEQWSNHWISRLGRWARWRRITIVSPSN